MDKNLEKKSLYFLRLGANLKFFIFSFDLLRKMIKLGKLLPANSDLNSPKIIFNQVRSFSTSVLFFESILAAKLNLMGANAKVLIDDGVLEDYDTASLGDFYTNRDFKFRGCLNKKMIDGLPLYKYYSEFVQPHIPKLCLHAIFQFLIHIIVKQSMHWKLISSISSF